MTDDDKYTIILYVHVYHTCPMPGFKGIKVWLMNTACCKLANCLSV